MSAFRHFLRPVLRLPPSPLWLLPLAFLWFRLIDHLRIEWTLNEQYGYGWAVPFLCAYLIWRNVRGQGAGGRRQESGVRGQGAGDSRQSPGKPGEQQSNKVTKKSAPSLPSLSVKPDSETSAFQHFSVSAFSDSKTSAFSLQPLAFLFAFLYLPTRLIQEANPEWRLVSWSLAFIVIGLTLLVLRSGVRSQASGGRSQGPGVSLENTDEQQSSKETKNSSSLPSLSSVDNSAARSSNTSAFSLQPLAFPHSSTLAFSLQPLAFPLLFFLVAVPWPTLIEGPVIQFLTRANATLAVELVNLLGTPAVQHGNVIEVGSGLVGIDEACSGIRSFQASLMLALFFSLLNRLSLLRSAALCLAGFGLSFLFNLIRTTLLTMVAAKQGIEAIDKWHDPASVAILLACFLSLWLLSVLLQKAGVRSQASGGRIQETRASKQSPGNPDEQQSNKEAKTLPSVENPPSPSSVFRPPSSGPASLPSRSSVKNSDVSDPSAAPSSLSSVKSASEVSASQHFSVSAFPEAPSRTLAFSLQPLAFLFWLFAAEFLTEAWYRWHERNLPAPVTWSLELPRDNSTLRDLPFSDKTRQFLRFDEGLNATWQEPDGTKWQGIFLRWDPGRIAVHLAKTHTPQACLPASGREIVRESKLQFAEVNGLNLPFRTYTVQDQGGTLHVFYCLWEDRQDNRAFGPESLSYGNRLAPVLAGRRNSGQRSVELAVWGIDDPDQALRAFQEQLRLRIKHQTPTRARLH